jgi:ribose 5-phosphate isomerase RpiB
MNDLTLDIERIVTEVLAQLAAAQAPQPKAEPAPKPATPVAPTACKKPKNSNAPSAAQQDNNTLTLTSRVVTMNDVLGRLNGVRRVIVSRKAIVTPAVRDDLLRRGIALDTSDSVSDRKSTAARLVLMTSGTDFESAALAAALTREGFTVEPTSSDCLIAATDQLAAEIASQDTLCVLLTKYVAAAMCLANRHRGVRAINCIDALTVVKTSAAVGANMLAIDPKAGGFFQLKQIVTEFTRGGVRPCPLVFREKLG